MSKKVEIEEKYTKEVLIQHFSEYGYILKMLLKDTKMYSLKECEKILNDFLRKESK